MTVIKIRDLMSSGICVWGQDAKTMQIHNFQMYNGAKWEGWVA